MLKSHAKKTFLIYTFSYERIFMNCFNAFCVLLNLFLSFSILGAAYSQERDMLSFLSKGKEIEEHQDQPQYELNSQQWTSFDLSGPLGRCGAWGEYDKIVTSVDAPNFDDQGHKVLWSAKNYDGNSNTLTCSDIRLGDAVYGPVLLCHDTRYGTVAVKDFTRCGSKAPVKEISIMNRLKDHPNIVQLHYSINLPKSGFVIVMEYINGSLFRDVPKTVYTVPVVKNFFAQLVSAYIFMHDRGVAHHDNHAGNLMLTHEGVIKVLDFDLSIENSAGLELNKNEILQDWGYILFVFSKMVSDSCASGKNADKHQEPFSLQFDIANKLARGEVVPQHDLEALWHGEQPDESIKDKQPSIWARSLNAIKSRFIFPKI